MKFVVGWRTTDNWFTSDSGEQMARPLVEGVISQPFNSLEEAERWIEKVNRDHPELLDPDRFYQGRAVEVGVKGVE